MATPVARLIACIDQKIKLDRMDGWGAGPSGGGAIRSAGAAWNDPPDRLPHSNGEDRPPGRSACPDLPGYTRFLLLA